MKKAIRLAAITIAILLFILVSLVVFPFLFKDKLAEVVKSTANRELKTEMNFSALEVSFFRHFPNLTVTLRDFILHSSPPFDKDTLLSARDVSFGVDVLSLVSGPVKITRVYVNRGRVNMKYNEAGASNFEVVSEDADTVADADTSDAGLLAFQVDHIFFVQTDFIYSDPSIPLEVVVHGINYRGKSALTDDILRLTSRVRIDSLDVWYDQVRYLKSKPVKADLTTAINMTSLDMKFEKNDLFIKDIPFEFKGEFNFRKEGYSLFLSLYSMFGKEYFSGSVYLVSDRNLWVSAKADINLDLQTWSAALGIRDYEPKGHFRMKLNATGEYATGQNPASSEPDTIILRIPDITLSSTLTGGSLRIAGLPEGIGGISFDVSATTANNDYRTMKVDVENLKASFLDNRLEGFIRLDGLSDLPVQAHLETRIDLAELKKVVPLDSLDLRGLLNISLDVKGKYAPDKELFPVSTASLSLTDGYIRTKYYPLPLDNIRLAATVINSTGTLHGTHAAIDTLSFTFEENPFTVSASFDNPENLDYDITARGSVDIGKIYKLFAQEGMELDGFVAMDLRLKGRQSDAMAGRLEKLHNAGRLEFRDIGLTSEYLPLPFLIKNGVFRFENDNIRFERFNGQYGASDITLNGHLSNVVNYVLSENQVLKGSFDLTSGHILADEFMAPVEQSSAGSRQSADTVVEGVIVVPEDLEIALTADLKRLRFRGIDIRNVGADIEIKQGMLLMKEMKFDVIGCNVAMDATYKSISPERAFFDFHIKADSFDVRRAYNEIELFRNISTSAGKCEGIVSLEYTLKGRLDEGMNPIYPSLEGSGVITLEKVKVMGLKLFNSMSRNLEREDLRDPDLSKVELKTSIKKNVITLEKTRIKISGFRFRVSGETNFNGQLNLKARLGLPPMGIVGIPMRVLGTHDNPKFKYGRGMADEDVEETEYTDELSPEMLKMIHNAKSEDLHEPKR